MQEVVILIGLQACGKSTFYRETLAATHAHVSKDNFKKAKYPERKQNRLIREALAQGNSVVVDNTNVSRARSIRSDRYRKRPSGTGDRICLYMELGRVHGTE